MSGTRDDAISLVSDEETEERCEDKGKVAGTSGSSAEASGSSLDADTNAVAVASTFRHRM